MSRTAYVHYLLYNFGLVYLNFEKGFKDRKHKCIFNLDPKS